MTQQESHLNLCQNNFDNLPNLKMSDTLIFLHNSSSAPPQFACHNMCHKYKIFHNLDETGHEKTPFWKTLLLSRTLALTEPEKPPIHSSQATKRPQINLLT